MVDLKAPTTYQEQLNIPKQRGCFVSDEVFCKQVLESINYYRLTAYFLPFKQADNTYKEGTSFHRVYRIYEFDRKLRGILFTAVEEVEVFLRTKFAHYHSHKYGADGYMKNDNFSKKHDQKKFHENIQREIATNSKVLFVKHHIEKYEGRFPLWVIVELFTFGMLSRFFSDMKLTDQKELAKSLYNTTPKNINSWLRCCTDLRNICAHYGRLYYRLFAAIPAGLQIPEDSKRRLWGCIFSLQSLYPNPPKWNSEVVPSLTALFEEYRGDILLRHIGFPDNWIEKLQKV